MSWLVLLRATLRAHLVNVVAAQASAPVAVTGAVLTRASGSWLTDGFDLGAEVRVERAGGHDLRMVRAVSATALTLDAPVGASVTGARVGLPQARAWEGLPFEVPQGRPVVMEAVREIAARAVTIGGGVTSERTVQAGYTLHYPAGQGTGAIERVAAAIAARFRPGSRFDIGRGVAVQNTTLAAIVASPERLTLPVTVTLAAWIEDP